MQRGDHADGHAGNRVRGDVHRIDRAEMFPRAGLPLVCSGAALFEGLVFGSVGLPAREHVLGFRADGFRNGHDASYIGGSIRPNVAAVLHLDPLLRLLRASWQRQYRRKQQRCRNSPAVFSRERRSGHTCLHPPPGYSSRHNLSRPRAWPASREGGSRLSVRFPPKN